MNLNVILLGLALIVMSCTSFENLVDSNTEVEDSLNKKRDITFVIANSRTLEVTDFEVTDVRITLVSPENDTMIHVWHKGESNKIEFPVDSYGGFTFIIEEKDESSNDFQNPLISVVNIESGKNYLFKIFLGGSIIVDVNDVSTKGNLLTKNPWFRIYDTDGKVPNSETQITPYFNGEEYRIDFYQDKISDSLAELAGTAGIYSRVKVPLKDLAGIKLDYGVSDSTVISLQGDPESSASNYILTRKLGGSWHSHIQSIYIPIDSFELQNDGKEPWDEDVKYVYITSPKNEDFYFSFEHIEFILK